MTTDDLTFEDGENHMEISEDIEDSEYPLEITIIGSEEQHIQSYYMTENELFALFNLLYKILKRDYTKKLEELRQSIT